MTWKSFLAWFDDQLWQKPLTNKQPIMSPNSTKLYNTAKACLNQDLSTDPSVPPEVSCAVAVNNVFEKTFGKPLGGGASTAEMYLILKQDPRFKEIDNSSAGDIWICASGTSSKGAPHGHVAIQGFYGIMSNNSLNGLWQETYTTNSWKAFYEDKLGFKTHFFRVL